MFPELAPCPPADGGAGARDLACWRRIRGLWRRAGSWCLGLGRALPLAETAGMAMLLAVLLGTA